MPPTLGSFTPERLRTVCNGLQEAILRNARSIGSEPEALARLEDIHGGMPAPAAAELGEADWWQRKAELTGLLHRFLERQLLRESGGEDFIRLRALAAEPARAELASGQVVACYPLTLARADRIGERCRVLGELTNRVKAIQQAKPTGHVALIYELNAHRRWQRSCLLYEACLPVDSLFELPLEPTLLGRIAVRLFDFLDGDNRWKLEWWRLRWLASLLYRTLDRSGPVHRVLGIPPAWACFATALDEMAILRQHLAANDERVARLPKLLGAGGPENWGWSGFVSAYLEERQTAPQDAMRRLAIVTMVTDTVLASKRAERQQREAERKAEQPPPAATAGRRR